MYLKKIILIAVIFLAFALRFWMLDSYPALNADEAAIGYNAYSLIQTGKDEHGNSWPVHFQSFNDYKPGLYFYVVLPFVKTLGLNEWAVRIPNATAGVFTVLVLYLLVKKMFGNEDLALVSSFFLTISPWHIHFSRGGWEVNFATFLITLGLLFFVMALRNYRLYILAAVSWVLSLYTYHAARIVVPLLGLGIFIIYRKELFKDFKKIILPFVIGIILLIPLGLDLTKGAISSRAAGVGLFADSGPLNRINEQRGEHGDFSKVEAKIFHNKAINYGLAFLQNWAAHYHGEFLFLSGDTIQRNKVPETGQMYLFDILFIGVGMLYVIKRLTKEWKLFLWWVIIAPTAAALTFQAPHALRAENMVIPAVLISAFGFVNLLKIMRGRWKKTGIFIFSILITWQFIRYEHMYWTHMSKEYPFSSQYGVKELVSYVSENKAKYKNVVVTDKYDQPYILFLFYFKYDPATFQKDHELTGKDKFGFSTVRSFDIYKFVTFGNWDAIRGSYPNSLIIGSPDEVPKEANIVKRIYGTNKIEYFDVVAN